MAHDVRSGRRRAGAGRWWRVGVGSVLACVALTVAGCTSVRSDLGTSASFCFLDLPTASAALDHTGHLEGVRLVTVSSMRRTGPEPLYRAALHATPQVSRVCLMAYSGRFEAHRVRRPLGLASGRLAVVAVSYPGRRLVATLIVGRLPFPFTHTHIGPL